MCSAGRDDPGAEAGDVFQGARAVGAGCLGGDDTAADGLRGQRAQQLPPVRYQQACRCVVAGGSASCPTLFERVFDKERGEMNATPTTAPHPQRSTSRAILTRQATQQHRGCTPAVPCALLRAQQGLPTTYVQRSLRDCPAPRRVCLTAATLHQLAVDVTGARRTGSRLVLGPRLPGVDPAHRDVHTGRCGHVVYYTQPWDYRHPAKVWTWIPDLGAGQSGRDELRFRVGMMRSTGVGQPNGDQGRARSPPAVVSPLSPIGLGTGQRVAL